jgi:hypothetical protein
MRERSFTSFPRNGHKNERFRAATEVCSNLVYQRGLIEVEKAAHRC